MFNEFQPRKGFLLRDAVLRLEESEVRTPESSHIPARCRPASSEAWTYAPSMREARFGGAAGAVSHVMLRWQG